MIKIEKVKLKSNESKLEWHEFLVAMKGLKVGESFLIPSMTGSHRLLTAACKILLGMTLRFQKENGKHRISRTK